MNQTNIGKKRNQAMKADLFGQMDKDPFRNMELFFVVAMLSLFAFWLAGYYQNYLGEQANIFFAKTGNFMADFFNVAKYSADLNPYNNEINGLAEKAYFPISYVIMHLFTHFADFSKNDVFAAGLSFPFLTMTMLFMSFTAILLFLQLFVMKTGSTFRRFLFALSLMLSGTFLFSFERGNLIILTAVLVSFYLANYNNSNRLMRELSFVFLAIAAALKGYPALLGLLLIYDKKYVESLRLCLYGLIFVFAPFLLMQGGFSNIPLLLRNLNLNSTLYSQISEYHLGLKPLVSGIGVLNRFNLIAVVKPVNLLLLAVSVVVAPAFKENWKKFGILTLAIILVPDNSSYYCALYLFPIIVLFFNEKSHKTIDYLYLVCFILIMLPYQFGLKINWFIYNVSFLMIWLGLAIDGSWKFLLQVAKFRNKKIDRTAT